MASGIYNGFKTETLKGGHDLVNDTIKCALMSASHTFNDTHTVWTDVSANEIAAGGGYTAGGFTLATKTVTQDDTNDLGKFDAADIANAASTISAAHLVLYNDTTTGDKLILSYDFGGTESSSSGDFDITWNANGIVRHT